MSEKTAAAEKQLVVFNLAKEAYAIEIGMVREIVQVQPITRVPGTPPSVEGVINLRGSIIPVVDLRKRFQLSKKEADKDTRIVVVNCKGQEVGVIVDSVAQVLRTPLDAIEPASSVFSEEHLEHLLGIVKVKGRLIILLDMDQVLNGQEIETMNSIELLKNRQSEKAEKEVALT
jgi:purine-binding chemotaxis protein CheW